MKHAWSARITSGLFEFSLGEPDQRPRALLWTVCALFAVLLLWVLFAQLDIVAVARGRLVPTTYVKIVQPAEAGIVREILVREGDRVTRGQVMVRLDSTLAAADSRSVQSQLALKQLELRRIDAQLADQPLAREPGDDPALFLQMQADAAARTRTQLDALAQERASRERMQAELASARETLAKLERTLPSYEQSAAAYDQLAKAQLVGSLAAEEKKRDAIEKSQDLKAQVAYVASLESSLHAQESRVAAITSRYRSDLQTERVEALGEVQRLEQEHAKYGFREGLLELKAPQDGIVKELATTTIGAVVQPGTVLLSLVPAGEPLLAEVQIENQDIGFVRPQQPVRLKLSAYPFQKYGMLEGTVKTVSADSSARDKDAKDGFAFKALVELETQQLKTNDLRLPLAAGMEVSAEIRQGRRTVLEYLLSPVQRVSSEAGTER